ncbi:MAG: DEAD/DEAH box helicase [Anaerolineales bacterium]|nr:DEAD/DEAH box helicase [Anaerolineales bacterium]
MNNIELLDPAVGSAFYGKFSVLHPIQEDTIQPIVQGKNVIISSATGSGKTEAVITPLISRYWRKAIHNNFLFLLYVIPTKALINDIEKRLSLPCSSIGLRVGMRHGDRDDLISGVKPHILLTTPESLDVMLFRKDENLSTIQALIIDEVHLFYNTQRGLQLSILIQRLRRILSNKLQWTALSATIGRLSDIRDFLFGSNEDAIFLEYPSTRPIDAQVRCITLENDISNIINRLISRGPTKLLVFANSRRECERLISIISRNEKLQNCVFAHYSSLSPEIRLRTEQKFAKLKTAICISTSTLELGIDIGDIDAVILWGLPSGVESFLQRIGRGNRRANKANVICLIPDTSRSRLIDALRFLVLIQAAKKGELPIRKPYELFGAICQQFLSFIASDSGRFTRVLDLCMLLEHLPNINRTTAESILAELEYRGYLQHHGFKNQYGADQNLYQLVDYRMIYGNFGYGSQTIEIRYGKQSLGAVPSMNLMRVRKDDSVRFAGRVWKILKIMSDAIVVEPTKSNTNVMDFKYSSPGIGFDPYLADRVWQLIHTIEFPNQILENSLQIDLIKAIEQITTMIRSDQIPFTYLPEGISYLTFSGYLVNKAIALITGQNHFKANDLCLQVRSPIDLGSIPTRPQDYGPILDQLFESSSEQSIYQQLLPPDLQTKEYIQSWLRDETIPAILERIVKSLPIRIKSTNNTILLSLFQLQL